jgi:hypothetical protein
LSELVWAISLTKKNVCEYLDDVTFPGRVIDLSDKLELLQLLGEFFDEATHAATVGYEWTAGENALHKTG